MIEIRRNKDGSLDEIVAQGCDIHLEQMSNSHWWMGITLDDGSAYSVEFDATHEIVVGVEKSRQRPYTA